MPDVSELFGQLARQWVDVGANRTSYASLRARVVEAATRSRRPVLPWAVSAVGAAAAALALVLFLTSTPTVAPAVTFRVGTDQQQGSVGTYYHAPSTEQQFELRFSDGSVVTLEPGGGARVAEARPHGATVLLEAGRARVKVERLPQADWLIAAGPYTVEVVGTSFEVGWTVSSGVLNVAMLHGSVLVRGPGIETGVRLNKGERFVSQTSNRVERSSGKNTQASDDRSADDKASAEESEALQDSPDRASRPESGKVLTKPERSATRNKEPASWQELAARGNYKAIVAQAKEAGLASILNSANAARLGILADAARYTGRTGLAEQVLLKLRERFPGSGRAQSAAFVLGRLRDGQGDRADALSWYEVYLRESPAGPLAAEAQGRRMLSLHALGRSEAAAEAARQYLERFPSGAYARHAQQLIGS
jgi:TolA-binding protein